MLEIPGLPHQLEVAEDIIHQQVLLATKIGFKYKTMIELLKKD